MPELPPLTWALPPSLQIDPSGHMASQRHLGSSLGVLVGSRSVRISYSETLHQNRHAAFVVGVTGCDMWHLGVTLGEGGVTPDNTGNKLL